MSNPSQIIDKMLRDGLITVQQSEYVQNLLRQYPHPISMMQLKGQRTLL